VTLSSPSSSVPHRVRLVMIITAATDMSMWAGGYLLIVGTKSHVAYAKEEAGGLRLVLNGHTCIFTKVRAVAGCRDHMTAQKRELGDPWKIMRSRAVRTI
jgi:hypothetical protein